MRLWHAFDNKILAPIATVLFAVACFWMLIEALSRRIFSVSFIFSEELVLFSLVSAIFLSLAQTGRRGHHVSIDLLINILPKGLKKNVLALGYFIGLVYCLLLITLSIGYIKHLFASGIVSHEIHIPMWLIYMIIPIGMIFLAVYYFDEIRNLWREPEQK